MEKFSSRKVKIEVREREKDEKQLGIVIIIKRDKKRVIYRTIPTSSDELWQATNEVRLILGKLSHSARSWFNKVISR